MTKNPQNMTKWQAFKETAFLLVVIVIHRVWHRLRRYTPTLNYKGHFHLRVVKGMVECQSCGLFLRLPILKPGQVAHCPRCDDTLARRRKVSHFHAATAFCITSLALLAAMLFVPMMTLDVMGRVNTVTLLTGPIRLMHLNFGFMLIGIIVLIASVVMPWLVVLLQSGILYYANQPGKMPPWTAILLAWYLRLRTWAMVGVYVIGLCVAYSKLVDLATVTIMPTGWMLGILMITMAAADTTFDERLVWEKIPLLPGAAKNIIDVAHQPVPPTSQMLSCSSCHLVLKNHQYVDLEQDMGDCPRCGQVLRKRKYDGVVGCSAFLLAAAVFYLPANFIPVMAFYKMGKGQFSTIIEGVIELWQNELYSLSILVLFASVTVPVLKIASLALMLSVQERQSAWQLRGLTKLYRLVEAIGRWSMIDPFMISILTGMVRFGFLAKVIPGPGMVFFALVVILTIFSAMMYDPRGLWDAAGKNRTGLESMTEEEFQSIEKRVRGVKRSWKKQRHHQLSR
ncbi:paraquat-inducible membrane protein A [Acetobacteraceae bacterium]|nr:paraquat-inducible membrane protein A [Acetobacteraceae bacterium]